MKATKQTTQPLNSWSSELDELLAQSTAENRRAAEAFQKSIRPFLEDPKRLRTLLGKIAMTGGGFSSRISLSANGRNFADVEQLRHFINDDSIEITLE